MIILFSVQTKTADILFHRKNINIVLTVEILDRSLSFLFASV